MQIWFLSNGSYSLKNCHNPFSKAIQPPPLRQNASWTPKILTWVFPEWVNWANWTGCGTGQPVLRAGLRHCHLIRSGLCEALIQKGKINTERIQIFTLWISIWVVRIFWVQTMWPEEHKEMFLSPASGTSFHFKSSEFDAEDDDHIKSGPAVKV